MKIMLPLQKTKSSGSAHKCLNTGIPQQCMLFGVLTETRLVTAILIYTQPSRCLKEILPFKIHSVEKGKEIRTRQTGAGG